MVGSVMGWRGLPRFPYPAEQGFGVYMGLLGVRPLDWQISYQRADASSVQFPRFSVTTR